MKYIKHNGGSVTFKHLKSHQKPFMCKFVVLFVIYFSHVFPSIKFCLQVPNNLLSHTHTHTHGHNKTIFGGHNKTTNKTSFTTFCSYINELNVLVQVLQLHSFINSISCLVN